MRATWLTSDFATYPGLADVPARLSFPSPFTLGDYKRYIRAMFSQARSGEEKDGDVDEVALLRQYRAALAVAHVAEDGAADEAAPFSLADIDPDDEALPMVWVTWVTDMADAYIGPQIIVETPQQIMARRMAYLGRSATFETAAWLRLLPDLRAYAGNVTFREPFTKRDYRSWRKGIEVSAKHDPRDVENSVLLRQYRAALTLINHWSVEDVPYALLKENGGDGVPLPVVSWLVEAADTFLSRRLNPKKLPAMSAMRS
ncbi:MAG: hypothetical protein IAE79_07675 [Anaerolinea sp.]|nr:hypothetical protein [Anaerolinea sp.]